jgi:hypothetical protein
MFVAVKTDVKVIKSDFRVAFFGEKAFFIILKILCFFQTRFFDTFDNFEWVKW